MSKKWYSIGYSDAEKILKTNAACGLSHKAARSRIRKEGKNEKEAGKERDLDTEKKFILTTLICTSCKRGIYVLLSAIWKNAGRMILSFLCLALLLRVLGKTIVKQKRT